MARKLRISLWQTVTAVIAATTFCINGPDGRAQSTLFDPDFAVGDGANGPVSAIVVQSDGRILVGGEFQSIAGHACSNLARLQADGQVDPSLGHGTDGFVWNLLRQPDGKVLVSGGFTHLQGVYRPRLCRLLANGTVDLEFDPGDFFTTNGGASALAVQPDGKVLVGNSDYGGRLFRLTANGALDDTFVQTNYFAGSYADALYVRTNGTILVGGGFSGVNDLGPSAPGLVLLDPSGRHATNVNFQLSQSSQVFAIAAHSEGGFWIGGRLLQQEGGALTTNLVARLTRELEWDTHFSSDDFEPSPSEFTFVKSMVVQPDGKIVLGGLFYEVGGYWRRHIVRLDAQGRVDPCFDPGLGLGGINGAYAVARQADGRILVGGDFIGIPGAPRSLRRLLPQSDCNPIRTYLIEYDDGPWAIAASYPPGGTNHLQWSSNLVEWVDVARETRPYIYFPFGRPHAPQEYFRAMKSN